MRAILSGLLGNPEQILLAFEAAVTVVLLLALALRALLDASPRGRRFSRFLTVIIEPLLLAFGIVLVLRLRI